MGKKKNLLSLLGAGLVSFTSVFGGNDAKAQTAENIKLGTFSGNSFYEGTQIFLKHALGSSEGAVLGSEDGLENTPSGLNDYFLNTYTLVGGNRLGVDSRPIGSQSVFTSFLTLKNISGSENINTSYFVDFNYSGKDDSRCHIARFNIFKEATGQAQDYVLIKTISHGDVASTLPNFVGNVLIGNEANYGYVDISSKFKNSIVLTSEDTTYSEDLSVNQVTGLEYIITGQTNGVATINGSSMVNFLPSTNYFGTNNSGFSYKVRSGGVDLGEFNYRVDVSSLNDNPVVANPISNLTNTYGSALNYTFPANTFTDVDDASFTYTANGLPPGISLNSGTRTLSGTPTASGNYSVDLIASDSGNLKATNNFIFNVPKASLSVRADNKSRNYGASNPSLTYIFEGLVNGDTASAISGTASTSTSANATTGIGDYNINISQGTMTSANYLFNNFFSGNLHINPATATATVANTNGIYGNTIPNLDNLVTVNGLVNGDIVTKTASTTATQTSPKGTFPITPAISGNVSTNYDFTLTPGTFTVGPRTATVGTLATNAVYGNPIPTITGFADGFTLWDSTNVVVNASTSATNGSPVGKYTTSVNLTGQNLEAILGNYNVSTNLSELDMLSRGVSLFANGFTNQYGNVPPAVSWSISNLAGNDTTNSFAGSPVISHSITPFTLAGTNAINISPGSLTNSNYLITNNVGANAVTTTAPITFNILGTNVIYKGAIPDLNVTSFGVKNGDVVAGIAGTTATNGSPPGSYPTFLTAINGPSQIDLRYGPITTNANPLNVAQRGLELRFVNVSIPYGDPVNLVTNWQVNGLQAGDNAIGNPVLSSSAVQGANVGNYNGNIDLGSLNAGTNYTFTNIVLGQVSITPRNASINIQGFTREYGNTNPFPVVAVSNLYAPDGIVASAVPQVNTNSNVGVYTNAFDLNFTPTNKMSNYNFVSTNMGDINITNAPLTVFADDKNKIYGEQNPILTGGISGLKNNDNIVPVFTTTALQNSRIGEFPINVNINDPTNRAGNYDISNYNGKLVIGKADLNVSSDNKNMIYGGSVPALTGNIQGLKNGGDGISLSYSTLASPLANAGEYPVEISVNDPQNNFPNYFVSTNKGKVNVGKAPLIVTGKNASRFYGDPNPGLEAIVSGGVMNGDQITTSATTTATATSDIGSFPVRPSVSGQTNNYDIALVDGELIVNKAPLNVTVGSGGHVYGNNPQTINTTISEVRNGDAITANVINPVSFDSNAGTYTTTATLSGDRKTNYIPNIIPGIYTVSKAPAVITAVDEVRRVNEPNPTFRFNVTGYKLGQGNEVLSALPIFSTLGTNGVQAGNYPINASGASAVNYDLSYLAGNLNVLPNMTPPLLTGFNYNPSNRIVNINANVFSDNPNGMNVIPMYSMNLNSTNWLPSGVTNTIYPNVINATNANQSFGINLTNQNHPNGFYKLLIEDKKN